MFSSHTSQWMPPVIYWLKLFKSKIIFTKYLAMHIFLAKGRVTVTGRNTDL